MAKAKTHKEYANELLNKFGDEYTLISKYINSRTRIIVRHNVCGNEFDAEPINLLKGKHKCKKCRIKNRTKTDEEFKEEVCRKYGNEYSILSKYTNSKTKIDVIHNLCGTKYSVSPNNFLRGRKCPNCKKKSISEKNGITLNDFKDRVFELYGDEYIVTDSVYTNAREKIKVTHNLCGNDIYITPDKLLNRGQECIYCNKLSRVSKGEKKIEKWLKDNEITYEREHTFDDCVDNRKLPFDFAIFNKYDELILLIEFDGQHHFTSIELWGGDENLKDTQRRDKIKNDYCNNNNINLLRIPYWEFDNIDKILEEEFGDISNFKN